MFMTHLARPVLTFALPNGGECTIAVVPYCADVVNLEGCTFFGSSKFSKQVLMATFPSGSILLNKNTYLTFDAAAQEAEIFRNRIIQSLWK
jgi:hypothetical protein